MSYDKVLNKIYDAIDHKDYKTALKLSKSKLSFPKDSLRPNPPYTSIYFLYAYVQGRSGNLILAYDLFYIPLTLSESPISQEDFSLIINILKTLGFVQLIPQYAKLTKIEDYSLLVTFSLIFNFNFSAGCKDLLKYPYIYYYILKYSSMDNPEDKQMLKLKDLYLKKIQHSDSIQSLNPPCCPYPFKLVSLEECETFLQNIGETNNQFALNVLNSILQHHIDGKINLVNFIEKIEEYILSKSSKGNLQLFTIFYINLLALFSKNTDKEYFHFLTIYKSSPLQRLKSSQISPLFLYRNCHLYNIENNKIFKYFDQLIFDIFYSEYYQTSIGNCLENFKNIKGNFNDLILSNFEQIESICLHFVFCLLRNLIFGENIANSIIFSQFAIDCFKSLVRSCFYLERREVPAIIGFGLKCLSAKKLLIEENKFSYRRLNDIKDFGKTDLFRFNNLFENDDFDIAMENAESIIIDWANKGKYTQRLIELI